MRSDMTSAIVTPVLALLLCYGCAHAQTEHKAPLPMPSAVGSAICGTITNERGDAVGNVVIRILTDSKAEITRAISDEHGQYCIEATAVPESTPFWVRVEHSGCNTVMLRCYTRAQFSNRPSVTMMCSPMGGAVTAKPT